MRRFKFGRHMLVFGYHWHWNERPVWHTSHLCVALDRPRPLMSEPSGALPVFYSADVIREWRSE